VSHAHARTVWEEGREPGRQVVALGAAIALTAVAIDVVATGGIGLFFDLVFVPLCLWLALDVRLDDFFTVGVLPPLLMAGVFVLVGVGRPEALGERGDGFVQAVISGLPHHSEALLLGYALSLAVLMIRHRVLSQAVTRSEQDPRLHA
jgi:uncharacterized protein DUF6542